MGFMSVPGRFRSGLSTLRRLAVVVAAATLAAFAPVSGALAEAPTAAVATPDAPTPERRVMNQRVFDRTWEEVRRGYYDPKLHGVDWAAARGEYRPQALAATNDADLYRVLDRMLGLLDDSHARAMSPAVTRRQDALRRRRPVLGVTLSPDREGAWRIERVREGSPADVAGVQIGWRLEAGARGWSPDLELVDGEPLSLDFTDEAGAIRAVELTPRIMDPLPPFVADASRPGVLVLRVEGFEPGLGDWMGARLAEVTPDTEVVVDLRSNPGGLLREADAVLSCFLPDRSMWAVRTMRSGRAVNMRIQRGCGDLEAPAPNSLAVLVDGASRSAAELTPAALQEFGRAVVVGAKTPGAVLISQNTTLPDGGRLSLSRADFVTARGVRLEKRGVTPDIVVEATSEDRLAGRDRALDAALAALQAERTEAAASPTL